MDQTQTHASGFVRYSPLSQCEGKRGYRAKRDVKRSIKRAERDSGRMHAYRCPHCGLWHKGHSVHRVES